MVKSSKVFNDKGGIDSAIVDKMVKTGICELAQANTQENAWIKFYDPRSIIGIKTNCLAGKLMSTKPQLIDSIISGLVLSGMKSGNIIVWERSSRELQRAGFTINTREKSVHYFGTDEVGYDSELVSFGKVCSLFSKIVTRHCDSLLNVPVLKDHNLAGLSGGLKNYYGAIHNPNKYHDNNCSPYVADVNSIPLIRNKNKLTIVDALNVQCNGGPAFYPEWAVKYGGIILGQDPVAVDTVALEILNELRAGLKLPSLEQEKRYPHYLEIAGDSEHQLGHNNLENIEKKIINLETKGV
ncbi:MAG: hypothetical protein A2161_03360 [Candidatus Schekmanbacteria bacterium RBG_13_48_7]|uniref:DUF362 domain-containing protein n=1 Tax=Candidatus Schekmanbacteria bacterium RBG_13_48_7 TaxID=1817878 RepID=A0A1F7RV42_9BACT|nr:MAG: hypothetical protein A2161_03360 [Candidatus Schekmanbacteria bacterium RBG_13_48_7]